MLWLTQCTSCRFCDCVWIQQPLPGHRVAHGVEEERCQAWQPAAVLLQQAQHKMLRSAVVLIVLLEPARCCIAHDSI